MRYRPGVNRQREGRKVGLMVDLDVLLADLRLGEPLLAERRASAPAPGRDHVHGDHGIAGLHPRIYLRSFAASATGRLSPGKLDGGEVILRRRDRQ